MQRARASSVAVVIFTVVIPTLLSVAIGLGGWRNERLAAFLLTVLIPGSMTVGVLVGLWSTWPDLRRLRRSLGVWVVRRVERLPRYRLVRTEPMTLKSTTTATVSRIQAMDDQPAHLSGSWLSAEEFEESELPRPKKGVIVLPVDKEFRDRAMLRVYNYGGQTQFMAYITIRAMSGERIFSRSNRVESFAGRLFRASNQWELAINVGSGDHCQLQLAECGGVREIFIADHGTTKLFSVEWDQGTAPATIVMQVQVFCDTYLENHMKIHDQIWTVEGGPDGYIRARPQLGSA